MTDSLSPTKELTKGNLMEAFWKLYSKQGMSGVSVLAITKKAGYHRSTFYQYFKDIRDLLEQFETELIGRTEAEFERRLRLSGTLKDRARDNCLVIAQTINDFEGGKIRMLLGKDGDPAFLGKLRGALTPYILRLWEVPDDGIALDYIAAYVLSTITGILDFWDENGQQESIEDVFSMLSDVFLRGLDQCVRGKGAGSGKTAKPRRTDTAGDDGPKETDAGDTSPA